MCLELIYCLCHCQPLLHSHNRYLQHKIAWHIIIKSVSIARRHLLYFWHRRVFPTPLWNCVLSSRGLTVLCWTIAPLPGHPPPLQELLRHLGKKTILFRHMHEIGLLEGLWKSVLEMLCLSKRRVKQTCCEAFANLCWNRILSKSVQCITAASLPVLEHLVLKPQSAAQSSANTSSISSVNTRKGHAVNLSHPATEFG